MPKSKRKQERALTQVKPKGREHKDKLLDSIRTALETYPHIYTFSVQNMRTNFFQQLREERRADSKFFMGNNKVMSVALGKDAESSVAPNLWKLTKFLSGQSGLFCTSLSKPEVKQYFQSIEATTYARTGSKATQQLHLKSGPLHQFPHSMYEHLRKLGLPVKLDKGVVVLEQETEVCDQGDELTAEAAQIMKLFGIESASFGLTLTAHWTGGVARKVLA